jgi:hypothetical protein
MKVATYEAIVENGQIKLIEPAKRIADYHPHPRLRSSTSVLAWWPLSPDE